MKKVLILAVCGLALLAGCKNGGKKAAEPDAVPTDSLTAAPVQAEKPVESIPDMTLQLSQLPDEPVFDIITNMCTIKVKLYKKTPKHRENFARLALSGYYDGTLFHRVIDGFMIQGGDPYTRDSSKVELYGQGGPDYTVPAEFVPEYTHKKGALAAARRGDAANPMKESSGSQFYLVQDPANCVHLNGEYTVFGETVSGLNVIDKIASVKTDRRGLPEKEVRIQRIQLDDVSKTEAK